MDYKNYIQLTVNQGIKFSIGQSIKEGFSHLGKHTGLYVGFSIVAFFIIMAAALFSMLIPFVGNIVVSTLISPPLIMGFALFARKSQLNQLPTFETFFDAFKQNYAQLILVNLIIQIVQGVLVLVFLSPIIAEIAPLFQTILAESSDPAAMQGLGAELFAVLIENWWAFALAIIVAITVQVLYMLANYFVIFYGFGFWEAMESSRQLISKVFFKVIGLNIVVGIFLMIGTIVTLGIGLLFLFPLTILINFSVFSQIAGFADGEPKLEDDLII